MGDAGHRLGLIGPESTSSSMLERARTGDTEAWRRLSDLYSPLIYRWCRQFDLQAADAADVAQDVFAAVLASLKAYHRDRPGDSFRGWLWTITRNKVRDHLRRRQGQPQAEGGTEAQERLVRVPAREPEASAPDQDNSLEHRAVELIRAGVEERTWRAFWLVTVEKRDATAVAEQLGISLQAVYDAKYRVRRRIRQHLDGLIE